ncbi:right-handed parallel beta-helix repeat-containing protein [Pseudomonas sp. RA_35y_Pfl2_P32]|uniref:right-handed parallel beta-helix repeat-containing protein n=1 Tax=Pseudomonas sp. RA_35y_Pfl2_P32 TaxID=3088705 RepID=UPI0030D9242B
MKIPTPNKLELSRVVITAIGIAWCFPSNAQENRTCQLPNSGNLNGNLTLDQSCTYNQTITINNSNTNIDCKGATLDGQLTRKIGILITSQGNPLSNVTVKNCIVKNFKSQGILITSGIPDYKRTENQIRNYQISPTQITLDNVNIEDTGGVGVFFHSYVTNSTLKNSTILRSKGVGIYLEQSSRNNNILNNLIKDNGESNAPNSGQREGLAIDSSAGNLIKDNKFISNLAGGIYLYKNCGEKYSTGRSVIRWQPSNDNIIKNNTFTNEKVGIWIASRQSVNLQKSYCGDKPLDPAGRYFQDYADHNTIENNVFCKNKAYIRVEGNNNTITNNRADTTSNWITEPTTMKARLTGAATTGNRIVNNNYEECSN